MKLISLARNLSVAWLLSAEKLYNSGSPEQAWRNVGPDTFDLYVFKLFDSLMVFLEECFEKITVQQTTKKHEELPQHATSFWNCFQVYLAIFFIVKYNLTDIE